MQADKHSGLMGVGRGMGRGWVDRLAGLASAGMVAVLGGVGSVGGSIVVGVAAVGLSHEQAHAQRGMGRMMAAQVSGGGAAISRRSFEEYAGLLGMTDEQKETAQLLLEGYRDAHKTATEDMEAKIEGLQEKARDTGDWTVFQKDMPQIARDFAEKVEKLEKQLQEDVKATLTPAQLEQWPAVERHRRRDVMMRFSFFSGGSVDLIRLTGRQNFELNEEGKQALAQYEQELDGKLLPMEKWGEEARDSALDPAKMGNPQAQMEMMEKASVFAKDIRDVNKRYFSRLAGTMDETTRARFEEEFNKRVFPRIYRDSHTEEMLKAAKGYSDLDESQKETVKTIAEQYKREAAALNATWAKAQEAAEEKAGGSVQLMISQWTGASEDVKKAQEEIKAAREARKELDDRTSKRLKDMLSAAQRDRLPSKKPTNQDPWDFGFMVEEEDAE